MLRIVGCVRFRSSVDRPNLFYEVREKKASAAALADVAGFIQTQYGAGDAGIVYCFSRKECETVAAGLSQLGVRAAHYHADMDPKWRSAVHRQWTDGDIQVRAHPQPLPLRLRSFCRWSVRCYGPSRASLSSRRVKHESERTQPRSGGLSESRAHTVAAAARCKCGCTRRFRETALRILRHVNKIRTRVATPWAAARQLHSLTRAPTPAVVRWWWPPWRSAWASTKRTCASWCTTV